MQAQLEHPTEEIKRLQRCINDLSSLQALPAIWRGGDPAQMVRTLLDVLLGMLHLDLVYVRLKDPLGQVPIEMARVAQSRKLTARPEEIGEVLNNTLGPDPQKWAARARCLIGGKDVSIVPLPLALQDESGVIVAGSLRADFPEQIESLVLSVAANQATIWLQEARLLNEQKRIASELDRRVAERTAQLAATNEELKKEAAERRQTEEHLHTTETNFSKVVESFPGLLVTMNLAGEVELFNQEVLEFFGKTPDELKGWATSDAVHPDDLPRVATAFTDSVNTGNPCSIEHRCRRADGVYRWFQVRALPVRDAASSITGWYVLLTDIDDLKRAENAIRASESNLKQIIDTIPALAWSARPDGSAEFFNQHYLDFVGLSAEQVKDWGWTIAVHPDDLSGLVSAWQRMMASDAPGEYEGRLRRFDGEYRWFLIRTNALRDENGNIVKWYGVNTDIEDRKRAEEKARLIIDTALDAVVAMDAQGTITTWNKQAETIFGWSSEEAIGQHLPDVIIPEQQRLAHARGLRHFLATGDGPILGRRIEVNAVRRGGGEFPAELEVVPMRLGQDWIFSAFVRDITDSKLAQAKLLESELNLRQLTETIPEMLWSATPEGMIDYCNACLLDYTGFAAEEIMDAGWTKLLHPGDVDKTVQAWMCCVTTGAPYRAEVRTFHAADRTYRWCVTNARALLDQQGRILKWHGTVVDMHDWKQAQEVLRNTQAELAHMTRVMTMGVLTASIAHEINQPLSGIITNASTCVRMLAADPPNIDGARETARRTIRDGNRVSEVITRLRALFTKKSATTEPVDLNEATREVIALSLSQLQRNSVVLQTELADGLPSITGDRVQLQQVILNLLLNASDAMHDVGDRQRKLVIRTESDEGDCVRLTVRDSGVGIEPQSIDKVFEPFYTTKTGGMGIGLSVSRSIVESHRGRLWAAPNEGHGATFSFSIPR
jgi:PAS domain S-box-containing protein